MPECEEAEGKMRLSGKLPNGWTKSSLAEIADIIMGQSPSSKHYNSEGNGLPFFQGKAEFGDLYPKVVKWCTAPGKIAQKDDVLISVRAPVGPTNLAPLACCIGRGLVAIRPRNGIPPKYILNYLRSIQKDIDALGTGTTFKAISGKTLREIPIPLAPLDQQKHIVAEIEKQFSRLGKAIAKLKRVKTNIKQYKNSVLKAAAEGKLTENWRKENSDVERTSKHLKMCKIKEIADINPHANKSSISDDLPISFVPMPAVGAGNSSISVEEIRPARELKKGFTPFLEGDVLFAKITPCMENGKMAIVPKLANGYGFGSTEFYVIRPKHGIDARYLYHIISSQKFRSEAARHMTGAVGQKRVPKMYLKESVIPLVPLDQQKCIVDKIEYHLLAIKQLEVTVEANLKRANHLRQSILALAFFGKLTMET